MLVPHGRENAKLREGGLAANDLKDQIVFLGLQSVALNQFRRDGWFLHPCHIPSGCDCAPFRPRRRAKEGQSVILQGGQAVWSRQATSCQGHKGRRVGGRASGAFCPCRKIGRRSVCRARCDHKVCSNKIRLERRGLLLAKKACWSFTIAKPHGVARNRTQRHRWVRAWPKKRPSTKLGRSPTGRYEARRGAVFMTLI